MFLKLIKRAVELSFGYIYADEQLKESVLNTEIKEKEIKQLYDCGFEPEIKSLEDKCGLKLVENLINSHITSILQFKSLVYNDYVLFDLKVFIDSIYYFLLGG